MKVQSDYVQTLPSVLMPNASSAGLRLSFVLPVFRSQLQVTSEHRDICELSLLSSSFKQENFPILNFYQLYGMVRNTRLVVALNFKVLSLVHIIWFVQQLLGVNNVCFCYSRSRFIAHLFCLVYYRVATSLRDIHVVRKVRI